GIRKDAALAGTFSVQQALVDRTRPGLELIKVTQAPLAAEVTRRVDDGLDPQGAAVFQILLDAGVLVEGVDGDLGAAGDDLGLELAAGGALTAADLAVEDDLDGVRTAEVEVVGDQRLKEAARIAGLGERQ